MRQLMVSILFCLLALCGLAQREPHALHIQKINGLPSNSVYDIHQDRKGYIWLATNEGLSRYDAFKFETFQCEEQSSTSGSCIQEDRYGRIWYENFDGFLFYVDSLRHNMFALKNKNMVGFIPYGITENKLFVMQQDGITVYDLKTLKEQKTLILPLVNPQHALSTANAYYFINDNRLYKISDDLQLSQMPLKFDENETVRQIYYDKNRQNLLLLSKYNEQKRLFVYDEDLNHLRNIPLDGPQFIQKLDVVDGNYWVNTPQGSYSFNKDGKFENSYFNTKSISHVIKDRQENYWFTTTNEGVFVVSNIQNSNYSFTGYIPNKMLNTDSQHYLIGTKKGELLLTDTNFNIVKHLANANNNHEIFYMNYDETDKIISYSSKDFNVLSGNHFLNKKTFNNSIKEICRVDDKYVAFAASNIIGLCILPFEGQEKSSKWDSLFNQHPIINTYFSALMSKVRGKSVAYDSLHQLLYYATNGGLFEFSPAHSREVLYSGSSFYAKTIATYPKHLFALSTKGNLYHIDARDRFTLLNPFLDIPDGGIKMLKKQDHYLILTSNQAIHKIDLQTHKHTIYNINIETYDVNDILLNGNDLFVLTNTCIIKSVPKQGNEDNVSALFYVNKIETPKRNVTNEDNAILSPNENRITIHYSILDYGKVIHEELAYNINNERWVPLPDNTRSLSFPSLASGKYNIRFKLGNIIQQNNIQFEILTPVWQRAWFILLVIVCSIALGYAYYRHRISVLSKQIQLLRENVQLEKDLSKSVLTSIKSQMNPHFFYNALNTIQAYIFTNDADNAGKYLSKFSKLTRRILEMSEEDTVPLYEEIDTLKLYLELEEARFDNDFEYQIELVDKSDLDILRIPPMLIQPYVENAIKHGLLHKAGHKKLQVTISKSDDFLVVVIDDNGIGRKRSAELNANKNQQHKSFASEANAKRLEVLNQKKEKKVFLEFIDKKDELGNPNGTTVKINIPLH